MCCSLHVLVAVANNLCKLHRFTVTYFDKDGMTCDIRWCVLKFGGKLVTYWNGMPNESIIDVLKLYTLFIRCCNDRLLLTLDVAIIYAGSAV